MIGRRHLNIIAYLKGNIFGHTAHPLSLIFFCKFLFFLLHFANSILQIPILPNLQSVIYNKLLQYVTCNKLTYSTLLTINYLQYNTCDKLTYNILLTINYLKYITIN